MSRYRFPVFSLVLAIIFTSRGEAAPEQEKLDYFEKQVRPILVGHCYHCHSAETKPAGGLRVDDRNGLIIGGNTGPSIVPGKPEESILLKRVAKEAKRRMPTEGEHLTEEQISVLSKWVKDGAVWPAAKVPGSVGKLSAEHERLEKEHWAWQPVKTPTVPTPKNETWAKDDLDRFVLSKLEAKNLKPVGDADKLTLIRRLTYDLTGLPPTTKEIDEFVNDSRPDAVTRLVDRLLASEQFGEQWGRHWLDVARYGESTGPSRNIPYPHAWKYRDYVIDSVNKDVPFNRFVQEQIAGDLLNAKDDAEKDRLKIATGFLALGVKDVNQRFKVRFIMDNVDEQVDAVTRSVLGLTVSCARCHDHKFDPITQNDYYAIAGIFTSTENAAGLRNQMGGAGLAYYVPDQLVRLSGTLPPPPAEELAKLKADLDEAKKAWDSIRGTPEGLKPAANGQPTQRPFRLKYEKLQAEYLALTDPAQRGQAAHGVRDAKTINDTELRIRGEAEKLGPLVPRGYLSTFKVPDAKPINTKQSGRLELAEWLTHEKNPLASRVITNRVWSHLFGRGIVNTVDNFGSMGDTPSHPELLDHLSQRFVREGWSVKKLVRTIVLSRTYQLSAEATEEHRKVDPANVFLWRHSPRRLTAEEFRDSLLFVGGKLDLKRPEGTIAKEFKMIEIRDNGPEAKRIHEAANQSKARSVYLPLLRGLTPHNLEAFDPVEQTLVTGSREHTTVPTQALYVLNSAFVRKQALTIAENLAKESPSETTETIKSAYQSILGRTPTEKELTRVETFLREYEAIAKEELAKIKDDPKPKPKIVPKKKDNEPPLDPDQIDQTGEGFSEEFVLPKDAKTAAWLAFVQSLYASVEFRFVK